jgi:hypothetical protein
MRVVDLRSDTITPSHSRDMPGVWRCKVRAGVLSLDESPWEVRRDIKRDLNKLEK